MHIPILFLVAQYRDDRGCEHCRDEERHRRCITQLPLAAAEFASTTICMFCFLSSHTLDLQVATVLWIRLLLGQSHSSGWCTITAACVRCGATRLVYTSTYNVVFGGQEIRNGDQSLPYLPLDKVVLFTLADHRTG